MYAPKVAKPSTTVSSSSTPQFAARRLRSGDADKSHAFFAADSSKGGIGASRTMTGATPAASPPPAGRSEKTGSTAETGRPLGGPLGGKSVSATITCLVATARDPAALAFAPKYFGNTHPSMEPFSNTTLMTEPNKFTVTADLKAKVIWDTWADKGPEKQTNITGVDDADLTSTNYKEVATDLTPDSTGVPPRKKFWSKDLTETHEQYHVHEFVDTIKESAKSAETWLSTQKATTQEDVTNTLLGTALTKIGTSITKKMDPTGSEARAYSAGAAAYKERAAAITARGDKGKAGGYPAPK